jgi:hypothetical protein
VSDKTDQPADNPQSNPQAQAWHVGTRRRYEFAGLPLVDAGGRLVAVVPPGPDAPETAARLASLPLLEEAAADALLFYERLHDADSQRIQAGLYDLAERARAADLQPATFVLMELRRALESARQAEAQGERR